MSLWIQSKQGIHTVHADMVSQSGLWKADLLISVDEGLTHNPALKIATSDGRPVMSLRVTNTGQISIYVEHPVAEILAQKVKE